MKTLLKLSLVCILFAANSANAQLSVNRSVIEFTANTKVQDIEVLNTGDFKQYLDMKVAQIVNPELESPTRVELGDARTADVIVSPAQLLLQPGQRKRVRIIMRKTATHEDIVYRLAIKPYTGNLEVDTESGDKKSSAIKVLVGYDLLLLSRPAETNPTIKVARSSDSITFKNEGNTNVLLRRIEQCDNNESNCVEIQPNRLYAGEVYKVSLPKKGDAGKFPVHVWQSIGLENAKNTY